MPRLDGILETCLYVADMDRSHGFYAEVMGLPRIFEEGGRIAVYSVSATQVLILFKQGASLQATETPGGTIPPHDGDGPVHMAFAASDEAIDDWRRHLEDRGIHIESEVRWPQRGRSLYFRDPDSHALEIATPKLWSSLR